MPQTSSRWSFSYPGAVFADAVVSMRHADADVPVALEAQVQGYGDNAIVWRPTGVPTAKPTTDLTYTVTLSNVVVSGVAQVFTYDVTIIDPDAVVPTAPRLSFQVMNQASLVLAWPTTASDGFTLQSSSVLAPSPQWSFFGGSPVIQSNEYRLTIEATDIRRYFRLFK